MLLEESIKIGEKSTALVVYRGGISISNNKVHKARLFCAIETASYI